MAQPGTALALSRNLEKFPLCESWFPQGFLGSNPSRGVLLYYSINEYILSKTTLFIYTSQKSDKFYKLLLDS